jgi:hypothetical protein
MVVETAEVPGGSTRGVPLSSPSVDHGIRLLIGDAADPLVLAVADVLALAGETVAIAASLLMAPTTFAWHLDGNRSTFRIVLPDGLEITEDSLGAVFVSRQPWIDPGAWRPGDAQYAQVEQGAALLAWLWSLDCPVVGRLPAWLWYRPQPAVASWLRRLASAGLATPEVLMTNVDRRRPRFRAAATAPIVHRPLSIPSQFAVTTAAEWRSLSALQREYPTLLEPQPTAVTYVCVVGDEVIWDAADDGCQAIDWQLVAVAREAQLDVLTFAVDPSPPMPTIRSVHPDVPIGVLSPSASGRVADAIARLLIDASAPERVPS